MLVKTIFLLGTSVGIKRSYYLITEQEKRIDTDTRKFLTYGITCTLFCVVLIRSYSFGWGRHPNKNDPPKIKALKYFWWFALVLISLGPLFLEGFFLIQEYDSITPLFTMSSLGLLMGGLTVFEAIISNMAAVMLGVQLASGGVYMASETDSSQYSSVFLSDLWRSIMSFS